MGLLRVVRGVCDERECVVESGGCRWRESVEAGKKRAERKDDAEADDFVVVHDDGP